MMRGSFFDKNCEHGRGSPMTSSAWRDFKNQGDFLTLHDKGPNSKCDCQEHLSLPLNNINWKILNFNLKRGNFIKEQR